MMTSQSFPLLLEAATCPSILGSQSAAAAKRIHTTKTILLMGCCGARATLEQPNPQPFLGRKKGGERRVKRKRAVVVVLVVLTVFLCFLETPVWHLEKNK